MAPPQCVANLTNLSRFRKATALSVAQPSNANHAFPDKIASKGVRRDNVCALGGAQYLIFGMVISDGPEVNRSLFCIVFKYLYSAPQQP